MKILMTAQAYYPFQERGGPVVKVRAIALGLADRGHGVTVLTPDWGFQPSMAPGMEAQKCRWGWCTEERGVKAIFLRNTAHYRALSFNPGVVKFSRGPLADYDVVHVYGLYDLLGPAVTFFCRRNHIPYVVEPMGMFRPIVRSIGLKKTYHKILGKTFIRGAYRLIATAEQEKQELISGGIEPARIVVRRNGVEGPRSMPEPGAFRNQWQIPSHSKVALFLGRLEPKKSPALLIDAFAQWRKTSRHGATAVLAMCGPEYDRGYSEQLKAYAVSLGVADWVRFTGPLYDKNKWSAYRDANVFVLPSQNENFGNSAAEAMVCGTPVIVTDQCGIAPTVADRAGLVVPHDSAAIASALRTLLEDDHTAARFRGECRAVVDELSWDEPVSAMVELYREALGSTRV